MQFKTPEAKKVFDRYIRRLESSVSKLPVNMQTDLRNEITGHIFDSVNASDKETELDQLLDALERLGDPEKFMKPMIADYEVAYATTTFNPADVFRAVIRNLGAGVERTLKYSLFFILYLTLFAFAIIFVAKIFFPGYTGLFYDHDQFKAFGVFISGGEYKEILGYWLLPLSLGALVLDYLLITLLMKVTGKRKK